MRPALDEHRVHLALAQLLHERGQADAAVLARGQLKHLDAARAQRLKLARAVCQARLRRTLHAGHQKRRLAACRRAHQGARRVDGEARVAHHAQGVAAALKTAGEQGVVGAHGADAHEYGGEAVAQRVGVLARLRAAHPARVAVGAGDASVGGHGPLGHHVGPPACDVAKKHLVDGIALVAQEILDHLDARRLETLDAPAAHERVGVARAHHHAGHARLHERVGARGLLAVVAAGLKRHVHARATRVLAATGAVVKRVALGMRLPIAGVPALPDDAPLAHDHGSHQGIRRGMAHAARRQRKRLAHEGLVRPLLRAQLKPCHHDPFPPEGMGSAGFQGKQKARRPPADGLLGFKECVQGRKRIDPSRRRSKRHSLLFHPDCNRWPWVLTRSCPYWGSRARGIAPDHRQ